MQVNNSIKREGRHQAGTLHQSQNTRRLIHGSVIALIVSLALFSGLSTQHVSSAQSSSTCLVKGNSYSVYGHIIDVLNGKSLNIVEARDFLVPSGSKGYSLYIDLYVNTNQQGVPGIPSTCKVTVSATHDFLWEAINYATHTDYNTQGLSLTGLAGEPTIYQFVNGGATSQSCRVSDTSVAHQFTYSRIIDQNGHGLQVVRIDYYKVFTNGHERLWVLVYVNPSMTFNPSLNNESHSCSMSMNNPIFKWRIQISGKSTFEPSAAEAYGGLFSTYPDIQQFVT